MKSPARQVVKAQPPVVGLAVDALRSYGRGILQGAMRYINAQRRWEIFTSYEVAHDAANMWNDADGAIVAGANPTLREIIWSKTRHVISCSGSADPEKELIVSLDDYAVGQMGALHLLDAKLKNFTFYTNSTNLHSVNRERGFRETVLSKGGKYFQFENPVPGVSWMHHTHWPAVTEWLRGLPRPLGVMAAEDMIGLDLLGLCRHAGFAVPEEIAIVGVNNDELYCETASCPLSSVEAGFSRLGYAAAELLDRVLSGDEILPEERVTRIPPLRVVRRHSTDLLAVEDPNVAMAMRFIRENACNPCTVADVLEAVPVGQRWLERQFLTIFNRTPREEILRVQMENVKALLSQTRLPLPDIALRCGFSGAPALGRAFQRVFGMTPGDYRRSSAAPV